MFKTIFSKNVNRYILLISFLIYLLVTVPAFFQENHVMKNLEPYPDGILFSLGARNLALGNGLRLVTNFGEIEFWVPPLYSIYLSIFYLIFDNILSFYIGNILLGLTTIYLLYLTINKITNYNFAIIISLAFYLSHLVIYWLPSTAMSENLSLLLFTLVLLSLYEENFVKKMSLLLLGSLGLVLVRFSVLPIVLTAYGITLWQNKQDLKEYKKFIIALAFFLLAIAMIMIKLNLFSEQLKVIYSAIFNNSFFNMKYILGNLFIYIKSITLSEGSFLWLKNGLSSWPIFGFFLVYLYITFKNKLKNNAHVLFLLFIFIFPIHLIFYSVDSRYILYTIIIFSISAGSVVSIKRNAKIYVLASLAVFINLIYQSNLAKKLFADNILGSSTAWQYKSILHFNQRLSNEDYIITALPPFLIDAYQTVNYRYLPLSYEQEFLKKQQYVWGSDLNYENILETYNDWIRKNKNVYISNAYITHQQSVINDFELIRNKFNLELYSEGCDQACNIYRLELNDNEKSF